MRARPTTDPTTPPAIAPVFVLDDEDELPALVAVEEEGVVDAETGEEGLFDDLVGDAEAETSGVSNFISH